MKKSQNIFLILLSIFIFVSCINDEDVSMPKPKGYFRIELPEASYQIFDTAFPYSFEYSKESIIYPDIQKKTEPYWINIVYPKLGATIYLSYKKINKNLHQYTEDAIGFANKHLSKADDIVESKVYDKEIPLIGKIYEIKGNTVACPYQFWVTDSLKHFVRGALYFDGKPNNDSLAPVIKYIKTDVLHIINTFSWKK